jgi:dephospho-CoA kinase
MLNKLKIAITGGIGAGKSEVSKIISAAGYDVLYADEIAKDILYTDKKIQKKIIDAFGSKSFDGAKPNKEFLSKIAFSTKENVEKINSIIHPATLSLISKKLDEILTLKKIAFVESALIYEANRAKMFDYIIHVYAQENIRIERATKRLNISEEEVKDRISMQLDEEEKRKRADFVIENNSSLDELENKTKFVLHLLNALAVSKTNENNLED